MGSRKISFDPAARTLLLPGLMAMNVSLCGPHSFDTSTLAPTLSEKLVPAALSAGWVNRYWYFFHQVGVLEVFALFFAQGGRAIKGMRSKKAAREASLMEDLTFPGATASLQELSLCVKSARRGNRWLVLRGSQIFPAVSLP